MRKDSSLEDAFLAGIDLGAWLEEVEKRYLRVGALRERMEQERQVVIKKMDELRVDSIIVDIGCWWKSMDEDDNDKMMQAVDENTIANSIEKCPAEVSPQEECSKC